MSPATRDDATLILTADDVRAVLDLADCADAVERLLALHAVGATPPPGVLALPVEGGGFHVKIAAAPLARPYFVSKTNGNFPGNPTRHGLPTVQGVIVLSDAIDGRVLALLDSAEITTLRTGAATAVAAKHLARKDSTSAAVIGCGIQGRVQLRALAAVLPLERAFAVDRSEETARRFAAEMSTALGLAVTPMRDAGEAASRSDACVTCTPSHHPLLASAQVRPGTFVAAVGADHPEKQELDPDLFRGSTVVVDLLDQCLAMGDLHHAARAGAITPAQVHAELGAIAAGRKPGRTSDSERTIFDSTGTALQDVAAAALAYERCLAQGRGLPVRLAASQPTPV
jgi:alanine dehydrogenase